MVQDLVSGTLACITLLMTRFMRIDILSGPKGHPVQIPIPSNIPKSLELEPLSQSGGISIHSVKRLHYAWYVSSRLEVDSKHIVRVVSRKVRKSWRVEDVLSQTRV